MRRRRGKVERLLRDLARECPGEGFRAQELWEAFNTKAVSYEQVRLELACLSLMELAQIGATPKGGVCRLTLTDLDKQGRDLVTG